ncbi:unnamed protein product [Arabidopsis thaliana]|uniref:(thale cress) hypothetical protein n=1 Tax=Arabidopsis thaliana TaxID=3702 RepID=A0A7G2F5A7_ARATH|nr:unnamed protein product [Arabidopsis thaliana]
MASNACKLLCLVLFLAFVNQVTPIDTSLLLKSGDACLVNAGKFIVPHVDIVFKYVWDTSFDLKVIDGVMVCY